MLTIVLDDYSRAIAGYRLTWTAPTALHTALTLRQAMLRKDVVSDFAGERHWLCNRAESELQESDTDFAIERAILQESGGKRERR